MKNQIIPVVGAIVLCTATFAQTTIVDWGGAGYVTSDRNGLVGTLSTGDFDGDADATDTRVRAISLSGTPASPTVSPNYSGTSAIFYGGTEFNYFDGAPTPNTARIQVSNVASADRLSFFYQVAPAPTAGQYNQTAFVMWSSADFIGGGAYTIGDLTSVSVGLLGFNPNSTRFLVQTGGNLYITAAPTGGGISTTASMTSFTNANQWVLYDTSTTLFPGATTGTIASGTLAFNGSESLTGVGFLFSDVVVKSLPVSSFEVIAIPEPSSFVLIAGCLGLATVMVRRRR